MNKDIYVIYAKRTPITKFRGSLKTLSAAQMEAVLIKDALKTLELSPKEIDEVIVGHVLSAGQGQGVARQAALLGGIDQSVVAYSVNMVCGSGMKSLMLACAQIMSQEASLVFAGGSESMSQAPFLVDGSSRDGIRLGSFEMVDSLISDGLSDAFDHQHMGITAERVAEEKSILRTQQDEFALKSQLKAREADLQGKFADEIVAIQIEGRKETITIEKDEYINWTSEMDKLAKLRPAFKKDGTVTAGNASGINDGASLLVVADKEKVLEHQWMPLVRIVGYAQVGIDPKVMGLGPIEAILKVLDKTKLSLMDIDLYEMNEAFASQSIAVVEHLAQVAKINPDLLYQRTNVNGGAIALGHPIGASGNRICVSLIHEMIKREVRYGCASLCIGGGMGVAVVFERVSDAC